MVSGCVGIVTGGGSGIGKAIATRLAQAGAAVVVADKQLGAAEETADQIASAGGKALAVQVDVISPDAVSRMVSSCLEEFGRLDILVNNAGIRVRSPFLEVTEADWDRVIDVNLKGPFLCTQAAARYWIGNNLPGRVVNITSINAERPRPGQPAYCASKGGLVSLTRALALELAPHHIRVNAVGPGAIETPLAQQRLADPDELNELLRHIPCGKIGHPNDIAEAVLWLASSASEYVTGQVLFVDGGWTAGR